MGLLRTILILIVVFYLVRIIMRYVLPLLLGSYMNSKMNEFSKRQTNGRERRASRKEGEVTIEDLGDTARKTRSKQGEYIDYEEIKD